MWGWVIFLGSIALIEWSAYKLTLRSFRRPVFRKIYLALSIWVAIAALFVLLFFTRVLRPPAWVFAPLILSMGFILIFKLGYVLLKLFLLLPLKVYDVVNSKSRETDSGRRKFLEYTLWGLALYPIYRIVKGMIHDRYDFKIRYIDLYYTDLPKQFDGFTITQFTDFHSGSLEVNEDYLRGFQLMQDLNSDLIVFTGDAVNNTQDELIPWVKYWKKLSAPYGKFAILGNHDYADYIKWDSPELKAENLTKLKQHFKDADFRLLLNETVALEKDNVAIDLLGIENWGKPPFPQYGNLEQTLAQSNNPFKVLLSHDPSHYELEVQNHQTPIHLTLSGHTHGMQLGFRFPWLDKLWSPVSLRYKYWKGLYGSNERHLYVNTGFGVIGFKGRINMPPEITQFRLKKKEA